jgi:hypothetical protein
MRRISSRIALAVSVAIWGCDSSTGSDKRIDLTLSTNALAMAQGATQPITVTIQRTNFELPVALSIQGTLPPGITATFASSNLPAGATTTQLTIAVAGNAAPTQSASFTVRAAGEGVAERTQDVTLSVTITGTYTLGLLEPELTVAQGGGGNATVLVTRAGGNAGDVALAVGTLPAGVTATFPQATTTTGAGSLIVAAGAGVAPGTYPITITSSSPGHTPDQTTTLSLVVVSPPATASVTMPFCPGALPEWFAYRNEGYAWQELTPSGGGFTFTATQRVAVAFTFVGSGGSSFNLYQVDRSELAFFNAATCSGTRDYSGVASGMTSGQSALVYLGSSFAIADAAQPSFSLEDAPDGALDLVATRGIITSAQTFPSPDRVIVRRGLDLPTGATIPDLNFAAAESFPPTAATATITGAPDGSTLVLLSSFLTPTAIALLQVTESATTPISLFFVPADKMQPGDLHEVYVDATEATGSIGQGQVDYVAAVGDRSIALGPALAAATVTMHGSGEYSRPRATFASQSEYATVALARFVQATLGASVFVTLVASDAYHGGAPTTWDLAVPDFTGTAGFNAAWMLRPGVSTQYLTQAMGGSNALIFGAAPVDGDSYRFAFRQSTVTTSARLRGREVVSRRPPRAQYFRR